MKRTLSVIAMLIVILTIISLCSCVSVKDPAKTNGDREQTAESGGETADALKDVSAELSAYEKASQALLEADKLHMDVQINRKVEYGCDVFETSVFRKADYTGFGKENCIAVIEDKNIVGKKVYNTTEVYSGGLEYLLISDDYTSGYYAESDLQSFMDRQVPVILIDPELYGDVRADEKEDNTVIFSSPSAVETFAVNDRGVMMSAEGRLTLSDLGTIEKMTYTLSYKSGPAVITEEYTSKVTAGSSDADAYDVPVKDNCLKVDDVTVPDLMYYSMTAASDTTAMNATNTINIASEAGAISKIQQESITRYESERVPFMGMREINLTVNYEGETNEYISAYRFEDGLSTYTDYDGKTETVDMTADSFKGQLDDAVEAVADFYSITSVDSSTVGDYMIINYELDDSAADGYKDMVCEHFFGEADYLDSRAEAYEKTVMGGYVTIDLDTLLPVSDTVAYSGTHTVEGQIYALVYSREIRLSLATEDAYVTFSDEVVPADAPEEKPKPLFYEVTSPEGNKMYLLGTIHVGDVRTSYLPDEIYDAFGESDVLAVESNILDFEDAIETDESLMEVIAQAYYYTDGTLLSDHVSEENYEKAAKLASIYGLGSYLDLLKPAVIAGEIDRVSIDMGRDFSYDRGVDVTLSRLAKKQNKDIIEVETPSEHYGVYNKFSEELNEYLLEESMNTPRNEYIGETAELFELWCEGDETKLREYLSTSDIPEDADEDELKLYGEYKNIILEERDGIMINKAKEYLSDEKVEFFAVGIAHLLSETGLVDTLRAEGYSVVPVEYK
ncbi:MAG: TraB/GumN family protein [Clostridia bacterium]|nr:TraB/GumN family protein [Clostridia bacterium]